ncbi:MAG: ABC transporter permease [Potamolinea sp.]
MTLTKFNRLGEWNPQVFREVKGRLKPRNILIAVAISLLGQVLLLMSFSSQLPVDKWAKEVRHQYCTGPVKNYGYPLCISDSLGGYLINWPLWWKNVFVSLSVIGIFALLLVGIHMLVSDLSKEEQRGTLNFLRLTPQSTESILIGKILGVPILLYVVTILALPLHFIAGLSAKIPVAQILGFYAVLAVSCLFFYSVALLFGLVGSWLGSFQAWLGSGVMLFFLYVMMQVTFGGGRFATHSPFDWLMLFSPSVILPYFSDPSNVDKFREIPSHSLESLKWFNLPVGASVWSMFGLMLLNYGVWTFWIWQGLKRCFHNPSTTLLGKQQTYWLTACFQALLLGFALNPDVQSYRAYSKGLFDNFSILLVFNLLLFLCLIAALSPHRQAMQDWARYRHQNRSSRKGGVIADLVWGEKSPALVAIGLNLAIASSVLLPWIFLWPKSEFKFPAIDALLVTFSIIFLYATVAQFMLFMKTQKRAIWAAATVTGLIVLPLIIFAFLSLTPEKTPAVWLLTAFPWVATEHTTAMVVFQAIIAQSLAFGLLSFKLTQQVRLAGESATKALMSGRPTAALK